MLSLYWLFMHVTILDRFEPGSDAFWEKVDSALAVAAASSLSSSSAPDEFNVEEAREALSSNMHAWPQHKPTGYSCYFLPFCAGYGAEDVRRLWQFNGNLESLKGTLLHKQAELFIQELAHWQVEAGKKHVPLSELLPIALNRCRAASSMRMAMLQVAPHVASELWEHCVASSYFNKALNCDSSPEYKRFEAWLRGHPTFSPYRTEWSIYHEDVAIAGQIDSLWFDEKNGEVVMADWKRTRVLLSSDPETQASQSFNSYGLAQCQYAPSHPGPCQHMRDCAHSHYLVQQHLYAYFLSRKYNIEVARLLLVQCHPLIGNSDIAYHEEELAKDPTLASSALDAFLAGWRQLLCTHNH